MNDTADQQRRRNRRRFMIHLVPVLLLLTIVVLGYASHLLRVEAATASGIDDNDDFTITTIKTTSPTDNSNTVTISDHQFTIPPSSSYHYYNYYDDQINHERTKTATTTTTNTNTTLSLLDFLIRRLLLLFLVSIIVACYVERNARMNLRRAVFLKMIAGRNRQRQQFQLQPYTNRELAHIVLQAERQVIPAKGLCCCYNDDRIQLPANHDHPDAPSPDFITCLFRTLMSCCCGAGCACWWQCCGMCAIGQEDREMENILKQQYNSNNPKPMQIDYITFQSFADYYPKILQIRRQQQQAEEQQQQHDQPKFTQHFTALSLLSQRICFATLGIWWVALVVTLWNFITTATISSAEYDGSPSPSYSGVARLLIFALTWGHCFLILYFVYWRWHRFHISFDAIVKYFASGFIISVFMSILYEIMIQRFLLKFIFNRVMAIEEGITMTEQDDTNSTTTPEHQQHHIVENIIYIFFSAFVSAACTEEIWKYFGFWMVETPDLMDQETLILDNDTDEIGADGGAATAATPPQNLKNPTRVIQGCNTTIAMITVATGFTCAENLEYIFSAQKSVQVELFIFCLRAMLPGHPLFAAIQSIGVVRRDIEGDLNHRLGRIILPAVILHGTFDFVLMLFGFISSLGSNDVDESEDDDDDLGSDSDDMTVEQLIKNIISATYILPIVLAGLAYYIVAGWRQRQRLQELDDADAGRLERRAGEREPLVAFE